VVNLAPKRNPFSFPVSQARWLLLHARRQARSYMQATNRYDPAFMQPGRSICRNPNASLTTPVSGIKGTRCCCSLSDNRDNTRGQPTDSLSCILKSIAARLTKHFRYSYNHSLTIEVKRLHGRRRSSQVKIFDKSFLQMTLLQRK
jgi:hypothetical protein